MVDIGDMAIKLYDLFPERAEAVLGALDAAVVYNKHNSDINLRGLSVFYLYGGRATAAAALNTHEDLKLDWGYTKYLRDFAAFLMQPASNRITRSVSQVNDGNTLWQRIGEDKYALIGLPRTDEYPKPDGSLWPVIQERHVCMYETNRTAYAVQYAIPAKHNGNDCDLIVSFGADNVYGRIMGIRNEYGFIIQKGFERLEPGDSLAFYYQTSDGGWVLGEELRIGDDLKIDWVEISVTLYGSKTL
jgi:hypothetical protein